MKVLFNFAHNKFYQSQKLNSETGLGIGGFDKVFEINRSFRNEGLSTRHNPEFTMLEFYAAFASFDETIDFTKNIIQSASEAIGNNNAMNGMGTK